MPAPSPSKRQTAERSGRTAETLAALILTCKGYRLLAQRFQGPGGEIDLVMRKGQSLIFVEVKYRRELEDARLAVTPANQARIRSAAQTWLARRERSLDTPLRYDIMALSPRGFRHHRDAFR